MNPLLAAWIWCLFHLRRRLSKKPFRLWLLGIAFIWIGTIWAEGGPQDSLVRLSVLLLTPLISLFFSSGVVREEVEDETLTYGFSRPVDRGWLYLGQVMAAALPAALIISPAAAIAGARLGDPLFPALAALLGSLAYSSLFALIGQLVKRPAWLGLIIVLGWEYWVSQVPGFFGQLTLMGDLRSIANLPPEIPGLSAIWTPATLIFSFIHLLSITCVALSLGALRVRRKEHVLSKS